MGFGRQSRTGSKEGGGLGCATDDDEEEALRLYGKKKEELQMDCG